MRREIMEETAVKKARQIASMPPAVDVTSAEDRNIMRCIDKIRAGLPRRPTKVAASGGRLL